MYNVDDLDEVIELNNAPQSSVGAPIPITLAGEHNVILAYYLQNIDENWDGTWVKEITLSSEGEHVAIITFEHCTAHYFGPPNDEAFNGHPLYKRGLGPYGIFEINQSSWIRKLEEMNSVHPYHDKQRFMKNKKHFIFSFHDSIFECIAWNYEVELFKGSIKSAVPIMSKKLK